MDDSLTMLRDEAIRFRDERDWRQFHQPKDLALGLSIEASELGELFLWKTPAEVDASLADAAFRAKVADEMADVQIFLLYLPDRAGIPLDDAVRAKIRQNAAKYPVERARGSARKYNELNP